MVTQSLTKDKVKMTGKIGIKKSDMKKGNPMPL
jgi:hypothetical protein